jgi:hypothetical protein
LSCCCSPFGGSSGGGGGAPIQNTRYWDPTFAGTSTGSIAAPYATLTPFFAELPTVPEAGWELWLPPGLQLVPDGSVPDMEGGGLTLRGLSPSTTYFDSTWTIEAQTNEQQMYFHDVGLTGLAALGGTVHFELVNCFVDSFNVNALDGGSARLRSCQFTGCNWPIALFSLEVFGGAMGGDCSWADGRFWDVKLGGGATFTPGVSATFYSCVFDGPVTIDNTNAPTVQMDVASYASWLASGSTFAGTIIVPGWPTPTLQGVTGIASVNVPANTTAFEDFAALGVTSSHHAIVNVNNTLPTGIAIAGVWCTPGGDNLRVYFANLTAAPIALGGFSLVWWATL